MSNNTQNTLTNTTPRFKKMARSAAWGAWLMAALFYAYQYVLRIMPNIMLTDIMQQFNIDAAVFGQFSGAYYIGYCLMHLPIGIMLDRYGPKKVMPISILLTTIGLLPIIFADHWLYPIIGRFCIGAGSTAAILGTFKIVRMIFAEKHFTRMLSFAVTIGLIGAIYGGMPLSYLSQKYGYILVTEAFAVLGVVFAAITYFIMPSTMGEHNTTVMSDIKTVFANRQVLLVCALAGLMVGPLEGFADAWGSEFLKQVYGLEAQTANYLTSMIYIGMCFAPLLSSIAEKSGRYIETIAGAGLVMLIAFTLLVAGLLSTHIIGAVLFIVGVCSAYQILAIYKASTYVSGEVVGLTTAVANMIIMSFGYIFHSSIGLVVTAMDSHGKAIAYSAGISVVPLALVIGVIGYIAIAIRERR